MIKPIKPLIYSFLLGLLGFVLFLCICQTGNGIYAIIRTLGMALATSPLIFAGLSFGFTGFLSAVLGAMLAFTLSGDRNFELFKNFYVLAEIIPALIIVLAGLPVKEKQLKIGTITSIITFGVAIFIAVCCSILKQQLAIGYDGTTEINVFLGNVFEKSDFGQNIKFMFEGVFNFVKSLIPVLPALIGMTIIGRILLGGYIGFEASLKLGLSLRKKEDYLDISLSSVYIGIVIASVILSFIYSGLNRYIMINLSAILMVPLALMGMAFAHKLCNQIKKGRLLLWLFYIIIVLTDKWGFLATVLIGAYSYAIKQKEIKKV